ncbi:MAG: hypothetical protein QOF79_813 [Actinomycetota bacterium]|nr:hypothetical protein [Actinomycetota bacterium]
MTMTDAVLTMWTGPHGVPVGFVWEGIHYRVTDSPTRLEIDDAIITHVDSVPSGWRFQGTNDRGDSRVFDVIFNERSREWHVLKTYA